MLINKYAPKNQLDGTEAVIGSETLPNGQTQNYPISAIAEYIGNNSDGISQNNINIVIRTSRVTSEGTAPVLAALNGAAMFTVTDTQLPIIQVPRVTASGNSRDLVFDYYRLVNVGKGTYGQGGQFVLEEDNLFFKRTTEIASLATSEAEAPIVYTISGDPVTNVSGILNSSATSFEVTADRDYYFEVFGAAKFSDYALYRFTGSAGTYGFGNTVSTPADFLLVETPAVTSSASGGISVRKLIVGATIQPTGDDVAQAVNRSFRGFINISNNEVVVFEVNRVISNISTIDQNILIGTEKYLWLGGEATLNGSTTVDQYELIFSTISTTVITTTQSTVPSVNDVFTSDVSQPHLAVNTSGASYVIDGTQDFYFIVYDVNQRSNDYNLYRFIGANGTYGSGGTASIANDFQLLDLFREGTTSVGLSTVTSPFSRVGTGTPAVLPTGDIFRTGRIGIREETPEELLDIVGNQTDDTGSLKVDYTYSDGSVSRTQLGGNRILNEIGIPVGNTTNGFLLDYLNHPSYTNFRGYTYAGDFTGAGVPETLTAGLGVANLANTAFGRIVVQPTVNNNPDNWSLRIQSRNTDADIAEFVTRSRGVGVGFGLESQLDLLASNLEGDSGRLYTHPHGHTFFNFVQMLNYGDGTFVEGYTHTDDMAKTGTAATTIGEMATEAGWDADGNLMERAPILREARGTISSAQLLTLGDTDVELIPTPGSDMAIQLESVVLVIDGGTTAYDFSGNAQIGTASTPQMRRVASSNLNTTSVLPIDLDREGTGGRVLLSINEAVVLGITANPTQGDGVVRYIITYRVIPTN